MLTPALGLQIGDALYERVAGLELRRGLLPIVDRLSCTLPAGTSFSAALGDDVSLDLDGGEGESTVFTGTLTGVEQGLHGLRICAYGPGLQLARARPAASWEKLTIAEIIEHLCAEAEVEVDVDGGDAQTALFVCEGRSTAMQLLTRLCDAAGLQAGFDGEGTLIVGEHGVAGEHALRYGRELVDYATGTRAAEPNQAYVAGEGGGSPDSDQSLWLAADFAAGGRTDAGAGVRWRAEPLLRTVDDARTAAAAWTGRAAQRAAPVRLRCWLLPAIEPGARVEIQDAPDHAPLAECRVRQIIHRLRPGLARSGAGGRSEIWGSGETGGIGDFANLLGGLGGLGGLL